MITLLQDSRSLGVAHHQQAFPMMLCPLGIGLEASTQLFLDVLGDASGLDRHA